jgi:hypothetical protein
MRNATLSVLKQAAELTLFFVAAFVLANGLLGWT